MVQRHTKSHGVSWSVQVVVLFEIRKKEVIHNGPIPGIVICVHDESSRAKPLIYTTDGKASVHDNIKRYGYEFITIAERYSKDSYKRPGAVSEPYTRVYLLHCNQLIIFHYEYGILSRSS